MTILSVKTLRKTFPMLASRKGFPNQDMHSSTDLVKAVFPRNSVCSTFNDRKEGKRQTNKLFLQVVVLAISRAA